ncbi:MAG TPA: YraN family protein [Candidatus Dormibacteraeota bacterium]|nr:YraN family protein [Candidatus Dormibacteraeota bacterium]
MPGTTLRRRRGDRAEAVAATYLARRGWHVLARNVRAGRDELDLLALDPGPPAALVAVEVRSRSTRRYGLPEDGVDRAKIRRCYRAVSALRHVGSLPDGQRLPWLPWRVDLLAIDLDPRLGDSAGGPRVRHLRAVEPP